MHAIETEVRQFVLDNFLFGVATDLTNTGSFLEHAIIDSTGVLELVGFIEARYHIAVEDHELIPANLDSIEMVARFVEHKLQVKDSAHAG